MPYPVLALRRVVGSTDSDGTIRVKFDPPYVHDDFGTVGSAPLFPTLRSRRIGLIT